MKHCIYLTLAILIFSACGNKNDKLLELKVKELEKKLTEGYKPEFSAIMIGIQTHHQKLYFSGINKNWELAHYNIHEIEEGIEQIEEFHPEHDGVNTGKIAGQMIDAGIEMVENAIQQKSDTLFLESFDALTNSCNACHLVSKHGFIKIKTPTLNTFSNQEF